VRLRAVDRAVAALAGLEEEFIVRGHAAERGQVIADRSPGPLVQHDPPAPDAALVDSAATFQERPGDRHLASHLPFPRQHLAHGPGEKLGNSVW